MPKQADSTRPRQRPGLACNECRRKKLSCDRGSPCGGCVDSGVACHVDTTRPPRGPKKGHLESLRSRLDTLERMMKEQDRDSSPDYQELNYHAPETPSPQSDEEEEEEQDTRPRAHSANTRTPESLDAHCLAMETMTRAGLKAATMGNTKTPESLGATHAKIEPSTRVDLNQLFFDRVYSFMPIFQRSRYFSWAKQPWYRGSHVCLQYAVWTLAASQSSQFQQIRDALYRDTRQMLETVEMEDDFQDEISHLELARAWILVAMYEFKQTTFRRSWISAGRAFRLVQLMKLHEIDVPRSSHGTPLATPVDWIETEEKRRVFWMAYCLDRFVCVQNGQPLTLTEEVISTRLPCYEIDFQNGSPVVMGYLSEAITAHDMTMFSSPFIECIIFSTLWGRSLCHRQQFAVEQVYGNMAVEAWNRHIWLDGILIHKMQLFLANFAADSIQFDPLLLFTCMIARATILSLYKTLEVVAQEDDDCKNAMNEYQHRASNAAMEILRLSRSLSHLSSFKIHPFTPIPLYLGGEYFLTHQKLDKSFKVYLREIIESLREMKDVGSFCQRYLDLLENHRPGQLLAVSENGSIAGY